MTRTWSIAAVMLALMLILAHGCSEASPEDQATQFLSAVKPGMSWEQVVAVKAPRKWAVADSQAMGGHKQMQDFNEKVVRDGLAAKSLPEGFVFQYKFHEDLAYQVLFNAAGKVEELVKMRSMKDLMN